MRGFNTLHGGRSAQRSTVTVARPVNLGLRVFLDNQSGPTSLYALPPGWMGDVDVKKFLDSAMWKEFARLAGVWAGAGGSDRNTLRIECYDRFRSRAGPTRIIKKFTFNQGGLDSAAGKFAALIYRSARVIRPMRNTPVPTLDEIIAIFKSCLIICGLALLVFGLMHLSIGLLLLAGALLCAFVLDELRTGGETFAAIGRAIGRFIRKILTTRSDHRSAATVFFDSCVSANSALEFQSWMI